MSKRHKAHIDQLSRYQTSVGRDLREGIKLDRNERVDDFNPQVLRGIFERIPNWILNASPESEHLYQKLSDFLKIPKDHIYLMNGITEGVKFLYETLTNPGDNVIVLDPTYPMYGVYAKFYGVEYRKFEYGSDLKPDWKSLEASLDQRTAFVALPNPNLPIESAFSLEEIERILKLLKRTDSYLLVDEAYHYFGAPTVLNLIDRYDNLIIGRSFSKAFGLAGIRLGFLVSQKDNITYIAKTRSLVEANALSMAVADYFLDHPELREEHVRNVKEGSRYAQEQLTKLGVRWHGGNLTNGLLIFLDDENESKESVAFLRSRKIYIRGSFEPPFHACVRISIGSRTKMEVFMQSFREWLEKRAALKLKR